jgi:hypothetical protein
MKKPGEWGGFPQRIDDVTIRFLDGQLSFESAVTELIPLIKAWIGRPMIDEERAQESADVEQWRSDRPTFIARDFFPIAKGRREEERKRALNLVWAAMMRLREFSNGAA